MYEVFEVVHIDLCFDFVEIVSQNMIFCTCDVLIFYLNSEGACKLEMKFAFLN